MAAVPGRADVRRRAPRPAACAGRDGRDHRVLAERHVPTTWFLQGRWAESYPELARRIVADGHLVGNHCYYHARMPLLRRRCPDRYRAAERAIRRRRGRSAALVPLPFSAGSDDPTSRALDELGYRDIGADVILEDWNPSRTGPLIAADVLRETSRRRGAVVLFHAWPPGTLDALPAVIDGLRALGAATFVRLDAI